MLTVQRVRIENRAKRFAAAFFRDILLAAISVIILYPLL